MPGLAFRGLHLRQAASFIDGNARSMRIVAVEREMNKQLSVAVTLSAGVTNHALRVVSCWHKGRFGQIARRAVGTRADIAIKE